MGLWFLKRSRYQEKDTPLSRALLPESQPSQEYLGVQQSFQAEISAPSATKCQSPEALMGTLSGGQLFQGDITNWLQSWAESPALTTALTQQERSPPKAAMPPGEGPPLGACLQGHQYQL